MIYAYSFLKNVGLRSLLKRGVCPTTPTSEAQRTWALKGVADGLYSKLVKVVNNIGECAYDTGRVIKEFSELESLKTSRQHLQQDLQSLENRLNELDRVRGTVELRENMHKQFLHKFDLLENMGFGLKELDFLRNTVNEIAADNNIPPKDAITKFLSDVERHYNNKLGFETKVYSLRNELNNL